MNLDTENKFRNASTKTYGSHDVKCRCEICICGSHRCPPGRGVSRPYSPSSLLTHNASAYPAHPISSIPTRMKPSTAPSSLNSAPFDARTTQRDDYVPWRTQGRVPSYKPLDSALNTPNDDRDFQSEQRGQYDAKAGERRDMFKPQQRHAANAPFQGESTTKEDYKQWKNQKPPQAYRPIDEYKPSSDTRSFTSEAASSFPAYDSSGPRSPFVPKSRLRQNVPFSSETTNNQDFKHWKNAKPAEPKIHHANPSLIAGDKENRDFITTNGAEFTEKKGGVRPLLGPQNKLHTGGVPFTSETSHASDYRPHDVHGAARPFSLIDNLSSSGGADDRDWSSEAKSQYAPKDARGARAVPFVPKPRERESAPLSSETTSRADFVPHSLVPTASYAKSSQYAPSPDHRDFASEASTKFTWHEDAEPTVPFKPASRLRNDVPFTARTTNSDEFVKHKLPECPAVSLPPTTRSSDGHMVYKNTGGQNAWQAHAF